MQSQATSYIPSHFSINALAAHTIIAANPFATFITMHGGEVFATQIPMLLRSDGVLIGHMARANPHSAALLVQSSPVPTTLQFTGVNGYISPSWYTVNTGVPTWNYETVQIRGTVKILQGAKQTEAVVKALIDGFDVNPTLVKQAWADSPAAAQTAQLSAILAFEVHITQLEGKAKLSQNRPLADRHRVIAALEHSTGDTSKAYNNGQMAHAIRVALPKESSGLI